MLFEHIDEESIGHVSEPNDDGWWRTLIGEIIVLGEDGRAFGDGALRNDRIVNCIKAKVHDMVRVMSPVREPSGESRRQVVVDPEDHSAAITV